MTRTTTPVGGRSPFHDIEFRAFAAEGRPQFDLVAGINTSRQTADALVSVRAAVVAGADPEPFLADARKRFEEQAAAMGATVQWAAE